VGILGRSVVFISLDSISKLVGWGVNWLRFSIGWSRSVGWSWDNNRGWGRNSNWSGLLMNNGNWSRGVDGNWNRGVDGNWSRGMDGNGSMCGNNSGSTDKREWSVWNWDSNDWSVGVSVGMGSIGKSSSHQAGENNEGLKEDLSFNL
jgi:hypothetical protein